MRIMVNGEARVLHFRHNNFGTRVTQAWLRFGASPKTTRTPR